MDFALLPPEINSTRMYAGPGSASMLAAAIAWDELATELYSTASLYESEIAVLTAGPWVGPSSMSMAAAAAPYVAWLRTTALQAEQAAGQAAAAAAAYEAAFAETVPPPVVAANRALLLALIATNFFGQNTPGIALLETQYADMWAQDTSAMQGYAGAAASATTLTPFTEPASSTAPGGLPNQAGAVAQATGTAAGDVQNTVTAAQQTLSAIPTALSNLANPAAIGDSLSPLDLIDLVSDLSGLFADPEIGTAGLTLDGILAGTALPYDIGGYFIGVHTDDIISGWAGVQTWPGIGSAPPTPFPVISGAPVAAGLSEATTVGAMSVPSGWTTAAPATRLAALALPTTSVGAAADASAAGAGSLFAQMALAGMAGRAMAGTVGAGGSGGTRDRERIGAATKRGAQTPGETDAQTETKDESATSRPQLPAGGPITSIAAELRELASLRDAGILTQEEFTEQKRRLLPQ